jgi:hypothetical protein
MAQPPLSRYADRGERETPFAFEAEGTAVYIRSTVRHEIDDATCKSRLRIECRMIPAPLRELRASLPRGVEVRSVKGAQLDPLRPVRREGPVLVVPLAPEPLQRDDYRAAVELTLAADVPTADGLWHPPGAICTGATPGVATERGDLTLVVAAGTKLTAIPDDAAARRAGFVPLPGETAPQTYAYHFRRPDSRLPVVLKHPRRRRDQELLAGRRGGRKTGNGDDGREDDDETIEDEVLTEVTEEPGFPAPILGRRLELTIFLKPEERPGGPQVVLRDRGTGALFRGFEGDTIDGGLEILQIRDNSVVVRDSDGRHHTFHGRTVTP